MREIDKNAILAWLNGLEGKRKRALSSGTKRLILATLDLVLQYAIDPLGALSTNPVRLIDRKRKPKQGEARRRILSGDEEQRLLAYTAPFPWLSPIITVALHEALRLGEALGLQWEDVDFAANRLHVRHSLGRDGTLGPPKGGKAQTIELTPAAREALLELRQESSSGLVFTNAAGGARPAAKGRTERLHKGPRQRRAARDRRRAGRLPLAAPHRHLAAGESPGDPARSRSRLRPPCRPGDDTGLRPPDRVGHGDSGDRRGARRVPRWYPCPT